MKETIKKLYRSGENKVFAGVCSGLGEYFQMDPLIFRIIFVVLALSNGAGILAYLVLVFIVPERTNGIIKKMNEKGFEEMVESSAKVIEKEANNISGKIQNRNLIGFFIIAVGIILLINQFYPMNFINGRIIGPAALVLLGALILVKK